MDVVLDQLAVVCVPVDLRFLWRPQCADPNDDMVLETALNGQADTIATFNLRDLADAAKRFGIRAERPATILRRLR